MEGVMKVAKRLGYMAVFFLVGGLMPFSILVAGAAALGHKARSSRAGQGSVCSVDSQCPPGFVCLNGRCEPAA